MSSEPEDDSAANGGQAAVAALGRRVVEEQSGEREALLADRCGREGTDRQ